jgi:hypothetical protein
MRRGASSTALARRWAVPSFTTAISTATAAVLALETDGIITVIITHHDGVSVAHFALPL